MRLKGSRIENLDRQLLPCRPARTFLQRLPNFEARGRVRQDKARMAVCNRVTALRSSRHGAPLKKIQLIRCQWSTPSNCLQRPSLFSLPLLARSFSSTPRRQGFWDSVWNIITFKQDFVYAKLHKAISEMLEDYDAALLNSFLAALHAVTRFHHLLLTA